jgi:hypothetical protein
MARLEALLRRVPVARTPTAVATPVPSRPPAAPLFQTDDEDEIDPEDVGT